MSKIRLKLALMAGATLTVATPVYAQSTAPREPEGTVAEVVVTAQHRSERLRDVPMSVTAVTADRLAKSGITSTEDLSRVVPAVVMPVYGTFLQPSIRGVSSTGANVGDNSNVAMYVDGVYQPQQIATLMNLPDVQQIEVLKGPQGALYGQNATGGAILVNSLAPGFTTSGKASVSYGNYDAVDVRGYVTGPLLGDTLAGSLSGGYQNHEGFRTEVVTGQRDRGLDSSVLRGKLLYAPTDYAKITLTGYYSDVVDSSEFAGFAINNNSVGYALVPGAPKVSNPSQYGTSPSVFTHIRSYGANLRGEFDLSAGTLTTTTAYFENKVDYLQDLDYTPVNYADVGAHYLDGSYFYQEINFTSKKFGPFSFLVGGTYLDGGEWFDEDLDAIVLFTPTVLPAPPGPVTYNSGKYQRLSKEVFAGYADLTFDVTNRLTLTAGGRYTQETQQGFANEYLPAPNQETIVERPGGAVTFSKFTPRVTARYAITPTSNVYASWGQGFKSGIINTNDFTNPPVQPEVITAYEVGYKGRLFSTLSLDVAAFYYDYSNLQVVAFQPPNYIQQNAASARIEGVDADINWAVTPEFTLAASGTYLDAHFVSFPAAQIFVPSGFGGNNAITADLSGGQMPRAPTFSGTLSANYNHDTSVGRFGAFASAYYNSGYGFEVSNRIRTGAYTTVDGELSFTPASTRNLRLVLWGKNLGDAAYLASFIVSQFGDDGSYAPPRTFGVRAEYRF